MTRPPGRAYLVGAFAAMFLTAEGTALGAAVPTIERVTGVGAAWVGQLATAHGLGALLGIVLWGALQGRVRTRWVVAAGAACMLLGGVAVVANPAAGTEVVAADGPRLLALLAASLVLVGIGFGLLVTGVNTVAAQARLSPGMLNAMHGTFGVGAIGFPVLVGRTDLATVFLVMLVLAVLATPLLVRTPQVRRAPPSSTAGSTARPFVGFILLAVGLEIGISVWAPTQLVATGTSPEAAATVIGLYFAAFTAIRFVIGPFLARWDLGRVVRATMVVAGLAALAAFVAPPVAWVVAGLGVGPMFPTTLAWMVRATGDDHAATRLYTGAMVGGLVAPAGIGVAVGVLGANAVPGVLAVLALLGWLVARTLPDERAERAAAAAAATATSD